MHQLSAAENPFAPLRHHTFDSTHIAKGVLAARVDHWPLKGQRFTVANRMNIGGAFRILVRSTRGQLVYGCDPMLTGRYRSHMGS